jgi:hypothetical protein
VQWLAWSANGSASGEIVYCHHGRKADFDQLERLGVQLKVRMRIE